MTSLSLQQPGAKDGATYELADDRPAPKGGLRSVTVSRCTGSRVYFHDSAVADATATLNFSLPAAEFADRFNQVQTPNAA